MFSENSWYSLLKIDVIELMIAHRYFLVHRRVTCILHTGVAFLNLSFLYERWCHGILGLCAIAATAATATEQHKGEGGSECFQTGRHGRAIFQQCHKSHNHNRYYKQLALHQQKVDACEHTAEIQYIRTIYQPTSIQYSYCIINQKGPLRRYRLLLKLG